MLHRNARAALSLKLVYVDVCVYMCVCMCCVRLPCLVIAINHRESRLYESETVKERGLFRKIATRYNGEHPWEFLHRPLFTARDAVVSHFT